MKKYILIALIIILVLFVSNVSPSPAPPVTTVSPSPTPTPYRPYSIDDQLFLFTSFSIKDSSLLSLIPNFSQKKSSLEASQANQCALLTSGGFYSKENKPIGLFISDAKQLNSFQTNTLFNGFFSINTKGNATIDDKIPDPTSRLALQSGPLLLTNGVTKKLSIRDDEPARRIVVAQTTEATIVFLALYGKENTFAGPKLADVPKHLKIIEKLQGFSIVNALNLDGGSASAFITKDHSLSEITPVGSFFCVIDK